jgi:hypothetical protein
VRFVGYEFVLCFEYCAVFLWVLCKYEFNRCYFPENAWVCSFSGGAVCFYEVGTESQNVLKQQVFDPVRSVCREVGERLEHGVKKVSIAVACHLIDDVPTHCGFNLYPRVPCCCLATGVLPLVLAAACVVVDISKPPGQGFPLLMRAVVNVDVTAQTGVAMIRPRRGCICVLHTLCKSCNVK